MNKFERRAKASYDKKADNYDQTFDGKFTLRFKELLLAAVTVEAGQRVLDVACGNGRFLEMLAQKRDIRGCGTDISEKMVSAAARRCPGMDFAVAGCDALPFAEGTVDVLTVCAAFHHFPDPAAFAREGARVLRQGGRLYIAEVYYPAWLRAVYNLFLPLSRAGDVRFYSPEEIAALLGQAGFTRELLAVEGHVQILGLRKR